MKRILTGIFAVFIVLAIPSTARADDPIAAAAAGLQGHTVYVAPDSGQTITQSDVQKLEAQIGGGRGAIIIAVLPESAASAAGGVDNLPHAVAIAMGDPTVIVGVVSGHSFRAGAKAGTGLNTGEAGSFAAAAVKAVSPASHPLAAMLSDWITRVDNRLAAPAGSGASSGTTGTNHGSSTNWGAILLIGFLVIIGLSLLGFAGYYIYKRKQEQQAEATERADLDRRFSDIGDAITDLDPKVTITKSDDAKSSYSDAVAAYTSAKGSTDDLDGYGAYVERAERAISDCKEYLAGRDPHPKHTSFDDVKASRKRTKPQARTAVPEQDRPQPTKTVVINHNYGGTGYGYYPSLGGWGYYNPQGMFIAQMIHEDREDAREERREEREDEERHSSYTAPSTDWGSSSGSSSGSGDWGSSGGGSGDWGGGGGGSSSGGGDW